MDSGNDTDAGTILSARFAQWDLWIHEGRIGQIFRDIDDLPAMLEHDKPHLRIQLFHRAGLFSQALHALREYMVSSPYLDHSVRLMLVRVALDGNAPGLASELLSPAIDTLGTREDLERALVAAHDSGSAELEQRVAVRLGNMFPGSHGLRVRRRRELLAVRDYSGIAIMYAEETDGQEVAAFYRRLAQVLGVPDVPDYRALVATAGKDMFQADAYRLACVRDALARTLPVHAFQLALPLPTAPIHMKAGTSMLLQALEDILLLPETGGVLAVSREQLQQAVLSVIDQLANNPSDQATRVALASLLHPSVAGLTGLALVTAIVVDLASRPVRVVPPRFHAKADAHWLLAHKPFVEGAFAWLKSEEPLILGRSVLPQSLLTEPADEVVSAIIDCLMLAPLDTSEDISSITMYVALAASVAPHCSDPDIDLKLLRTFADTLATSGHTQRARDLVEQALLNSTATPHRRRLGWFVMADVYHRCHNHVEGLLALACTLAVDSAVDEEQVCQERVAIVRFLRDCRLYEEARLAIRYARKVFDRTGLSEAYSHRLDTLELQIRQLDLQANGAGRADLEALLADVIRHASAVLEKNDMTEPVAAILGQLLRQARIAGAMIPPQADDLVTKLSISAQGHLSSLIATISAATPSADQLLALVNRAGTARYADDIGYDMHEVTIAARRALASDTYITNARHASLALEMLADRGVAAAGWDEHAAPPPSAQHVDEPAEIACLLSTEGMSVLQMGFDAAGSLVFVNAVAGNLETPVRKAGDTRALVARWLRQYPYEYGNDETTINLFYTTTTRLGLPAPPQYGPVVVVADVELQPFPPNLLTIKDEFAGRTRPMAAAPSLLWLRAARARGVTGDGRLCAWVSVATGGTGAQTLPMIAMRLSSTFEQYAFVVDNSQTLPSTFAGASMAVIVAHGRIHPDERFFQVVSDEGHLRVAAGELADALRNIDVVVLFVCSGGRIDRHPGAVTTLGLAKQILNRGCSVVIASPWPLDSRVPSHWLPEFLRHWCEGCNVAEANYAANQILDKQFARDPARSLAMTVFGNPGLYRQP